MGGGGGSGRGRIGITVVIFQENKIHPAGEVARIQLPKNASGFDSMRLGTKQHRKSMLLSELCVVSVSLPAAVAQGQKGHGCVLKCRFSPYTQIEYLRVAILKVLVKNSSVCDVMCCSNVL